PKTAITASPMNFSGLPRRAVSSSEAASKNRPRSSRERSASRRWARPVESTRSANKTVTIFRSSVSTRGPAAAPQLGQKRAPSGMGRPQTAHARTMEAEYAARDACRHQAQSDKPGSALRPPLEEGAGVHRERG